MGSARTSAVLVVADGRTLRRERLQRDGGRIAAEADDFQDGAIDPLNGRPCCFGDRALQYQRPRVVGDSAHHVESSWRARDRHRCATLEQPSFAQRVDNSGEAILHRQSIPAHEASAATAARLASGREHWRNPPMRPQPPRSAAHRAAGHEDSSRSRRSLPR